MTVPGGQEQDVVLSAEEVEAMADAIVEVLADFVPLCNDSEFQAIDRARAYAQELASMVIALRVRADQAEQLLAAGEGRVREIVDDVLLQRADRAVAEAESLRRRVTAAETAMYEIVKRSRRYYAGAASRAQAMGEITNIANDVLASAALDAADATQERRAAVEAAREQRDERMMSAVTIYGASDDLIEIEGDLEEEFYVRNYSGREPVLLAFGDGTLLSIDMDPFGVWRISCTAHGTAFFEHDEDPGDDENRYSDRVTLTGDLRWVLGAETSILHKIPAAPSGGVG
jgi:hypothetical protein